MRLACLSQDVRAYGGAGRMFTVELYAGIRRAVMVEELPYILLVAIKGELGLFLPTLVLNKCL